MPADLQTIVQRMIDAGEPEEAIASVIQHSRTAKPEDVSEKAYHALGDVSPGEAARAGIQHTKEHPVGTAAMLAIPGILGAAGKYGPPLVRAGVEALGKPAVGSTIGGVSGAYSGYKSGGLQGAVTGGIVGAGVGAAGSSKFGGWLERLGLSKPPIVDAPLPPALDALMNGASMDELSAVVGTKAAPAAQTGASRLQNEIGSRIDWRTTDAVPIDAIKRDVSSGGSIIEAGESIPGLSDRLAQLLKNPTPSAVKQAEELARAIRQRGHITAKSH